MRTAGQRLIRAAKQAEEIAKRVPTTSVEDELKSLRVLVEQFEKLDYDARLRTLRYLWNRYT